MKSYSTWHAFTKEQTSIRTVVSIQYWHLERFTISKIDSNGFFMAAEIERD